MRAVRAAGADELEVTAWTEDETIMAVKHRRYPKIQGVQFHPESVCSEFGERLYRNFASLAAKHNAARCKRSRGRFPAAPKPLRRWPMLRLYVVPVLTLHPKHPNGGGG